jgi:hypothetical protein
MNSAISSSVKTIFARSFVPTLRYFQVATGVTVTGMPFNAPLPRVCSPEAQRLNNIAYCAATCCWASSRVFEVVSIA